MTYIPHHYANLLLHQLPTLKTQPQILDVGCGEGWLTRQLSKTYPGATITGTDKDYKKIQKCRYEASNQNLSIHYQILNHDQSKLALEEFYDLICCHNVLAHSQNPQQLIQKLANQLNQGGTLSIISENPAAKALEENFRALSPTADIQLEIIGKIYDLHVEQVKERVQKSLDLRILYPLEDLLHWSNQLGKGYDVEVKGLSYIMDYLDESYYWLEEEVALQNNTTFFSYFYHILVKKLS